MRTQVQSTVQIFKDLIKEVEGHYADLSKGRDGYMSEVVLWSALYHARVEAEKAYDALVAHGEHEHPNGIPSTL